MIIFLLVKVGFSEYGEKLWKLRKENWEYGWIKIVIIFWIEWDWDWQKLIIWDDNNSFCSFVFIFNSSVNKSLMQKHS